MPTAREVRERAASAALAGVSADPLSDVVEGEEAPPLEPTAVEVMPEEIAAAPPGQDIWEDQGFRFELIESPEGREIKMTPVDGSGETISITNPEEIEFILQQRGGSGAEIEAEEQIIG